MNESDKANIIFIMERIRNRLFSLTEDYNQVYEVVGIMLRELDE